MGGCGRNSVETWPASSNFGTMLAEIGQTRPEFGQISAPGATCRQLLRNFWTTSEHAGVAGGDFQGRVARNVSATSGSLHPPAMPGLCMAGSAKHRLKFRRSRPNFVQNGPMLVKSGPTLANVTRLRLTCGRSSSKLGRKRLPRCGTSCAWVATTIAVVYNCSESMVYVVYRRTCVYTQIASAGDPLRCNLNTISMWRQIRRHL